MSGQELVDELRDVEQWDEADRKALRNRAADRIEAQEKALKDCADNADKAVDELLARTERAEQKSAELATVIAEALAEHSPHMMRGDEYEPLGESCAECHGLTWPCATVRILSAVPAEVLSAYTTRIREEAVAGVVQNFADLIFTAGLRSPESTLAVTALKQVLASEIPEGQNDNE